MSIAWTKDDQVKVLDFGLVEAFEPHGAPAIPGDVASAPTADVAP